MAFSLTTAAAIAAVTILPARAQAPITLLETLAGLKFCKSVTDPAQRLKCFDGLSTDTPASRTPSEAAAAPSTWSIDESKSPIDDSPQVTATLMTSDGRTGLTMRCKEHKTEVIFGGLFAFFGENAPIKVTVRINDEKPISTGWHPSSNGQAAFAPSPVQFIEALPENGKVFIRATGFDGRDFDGSFPLGDVSAVRQKVAAACGWPKK